MVVQIIEDTERKREIVEHCDTVFSRPITLRDNYEEIFNRIDRHAMFFAAVEDRRVIGYAAVYMDDMETKAAYITMIGVIGEMQGRHVGGTLMRSCIEEALRRGMTSIRLEVLKTDAIAITFYDHQGFVYEKDCTEDSIYMVKQIAPVDGEGAGEP